MKQTDKKPLKYAHTDKKPLKYANTDKKPLKYANTDKNKKYLITCRRYRPTALNSEYIYCHFVFCFHNCVMNNSLARAQLCFTLGKNN